MNFRRRLLISVLSGTIGAIEWGSEAKRRWPLIVAILRGREVAYGLTIDNGTLTVKRDGACIFDTTIIPGRPKIFVDFNTHGPDSRYYVASLHRFDHRPELGERFVATDFEDFDQVECEIIAIDHLAGRVYHRPVDPAAVPGTFETSDVGLSA